MTVISKEDRQIDILIESFRKNVKSGDTEGAHSDYDEILFLIAGKHAPKLLSELEEIRGDMSFWYA